MFKKYAKSFLEKEVTDTTSLFQEEPARRPLSFSSPLETPSLKEGSSEKSDFFLESLEEPETIIGELVTMKGTVSFERFLRIDGTFEGELVSNGKLLVGPKGVVKANIDLEEAFISGKVEGNINVTGRLVLRDKAEIRGNITAPSISVDEGVSILGHVTVISQADSQTQQI